MQHMLCRGLPPLPLLLLPVCVCRYPSVVRPAAVGEAATALTYRGRTKRLFLFALFSPLAPLLYVWTVAYVSGLGWAVHHRSTDSICPLHSYNPYVGEMFSHSCLALLHISKETATAMRQYLALHRGCGYGRDRCYPLTCGGVMGECLTRCVRGWCAWTVSG